MSDDATAADLARRAVDLALDADNVTPAIANLFNRLIDLIDAQSTEIAKLTRVSAELRSRTVGLARVGGRR